MVYHVGGVQHKGIPWIDGLACFLIDNIVNVKECAIEAVIVLTHALTLWLDVTRINYGFVDTEAFTALGARQNLAYLMKQGIVYVWSVFRCVFECKQCMQGVPAVFSPYSLIHFFLYRRLYTRIKKRHGISIFAKTQATQASHVDTTGHPRVKNAQLCQS
jgi:hypothetical protein